MAALLEAEGISKRFGGLQAVNRVSLTLDDGEILGIIGPNGAGKSTLFNILSGYTQPDSGVLRFRGESIGGRLPEQLAQAGLVKTFQTSRPFASMTLLENVMVGALARHSGIAAAREEAGRCLDLVGLTPWRDLLGRGASTGQRKRLEIARALATKPKVMLLDEPLGGVDPASIASLIELLHTVRTAGVSLLVIEHNLEAVCRLVDRLIAMDLGETIAEGAPEEVIADPHVVRAYLGAAA